ncbi:MAG: beta-galactosidase [Lachnospiraceae bacterium]|nr:beta-galactosidase [Lachnospiraceae bacterium]
MAPIQELMKKKLVFGAWCVFEEEILDEERCKRVRESGLDFGYISLNADHSNALPILDACQRNDLLALVFDPKVQNLFEDQIYKLKGNIADYKDHPALAGFCLRDEPGVDDFSRLKKLTEACLKEAPDKMPAINLFPMYANSDQLGCGSYQEHIDRYADELALDTISYDFYPLYGPNGETWLQDNYLRNFEIVAQACKRTGCDMWYFIQTLAFNYILRDPAIEDIRWQMYVAMSFGAKVIQLFTYGTPGNGDEFFEDSMIDREGNATRRYYDVQQVIREMNAFTGHYVPYKWEGVMANRNGLVTSERDIEVVFPGYTFTTHMNGTYMELDHELESFAPVTAFSGEYPLLMGCFTQGDKKAFTLVNMEDPGRRRSNRAAVTFDAPKTLMVHGKDGSVKISVSDTWEVELGIGDGLFVEILS